MSQFNSEVELTVVLDCRNFLIPGIKFILVLEIRVLSCQSLRLSFEKLPLMTLSILEFSYNYQIMINEEKEFNRNI